MRDDGGGNALYPLACAGPENGKARRRTKSRTGNEGKGRGGQSKMADSSGGEITRTKVPSLGKLVPSVTDSGRRKIRG